MVPTQTTALALDDYQYAKSPGYEPLPGYRVIEPLGHGGFGEVWLCEAPGGLHKAVKFVAPDTEGTGNTSLKQEYEAFQTIKTIRHPFLLTLERVELVDGELVMVMELADAHLEHRYVECRAAGLPGIPRPELLGYLSDAAEALDHISHKYGLQHLDVKPANLFLLSGHVKVGDYGLVARLTAGGGTNPMLNRGMTPKYVAPEVLRGQVHLRSDEYSLALVYQELMTGTFPYVARSAQQMMLAHVSSAPLLGGLPPADQPVVAKALAKNPADRYPSCLAFVQALIAATVPELNQAETLPPMDTRFTRPPGPVADQATDQMVQPPMDSLPPGWMPPRQQTPARPPSLVGVPSQALNTTISQPGLGSQTVPAERRPDPMPALRTVGQRPAASPSGPIAGPPRPAPRPAPKTECFDPPDPVELAAAPALQGVKLPGIRSVVTVSALQGFDAPQSVLWADQIIEAVLAKAAAGANPPKMPGEIGRRTDGTFVSRFPTTMAASMLRTKCEPMVEAGWFDQIEQPDRHTYVLRQYMQTGGLWSRLAGAKKAGLELTVHWPTSRGCGEVELFGKLFGDPTAVFVRDSIEVIPQLMEELRTAFQNVEDRRKTPRLPTDMPVTLYPVGDDGSIQPVVTARCLDVSAGGLGCYALTPPTSRYCFAAFQGCGIADGMAVLVRLLRVFFNGQQHVICGKFRTDL
jgi:serine/threonine protein kinase